jgi:aerobic-type carbon monoxide dehydrogenase small subunit (CoxS/CutS family)
MTTTISFTLNGRRLSLDVAPHEVLLEALRDRLGVKSPKCGCDRGDCGTCTVMIGGRTARSCLVLAIEVDGQAVTTLEGLMPGGKINPLQRALLDRNAFQCGFCAPGMILSATELLRKNPQPSDREIREAVAGNLCRCTGYTPIVDAVKEFAASSNNGPSRAPAPGGRGKTARRRT